MDAIDRFRLEPQAPETLRAILIAQDGSTLEVEGQVLEKQFRCAAGYLVITSDGIPFEEALHFYLLDGESKFLDGVTLGRMYNSGILQDLTLRGEALEFAFFGKDRWRLSILDSPRAALFSHPWSSVRGIGPWRMGHYLKLQRMG